MTFFRTFCMGTNLRTLAPTFTFPAETEYQTLLKRFEEAFVAHSLPHNVLSFSYQTESIPPFSLQEAKLKRLEHDTYKLLLERINRDLPPSSHFGDWFSDSQTALLGMHVQYCDKLEYGNISYSTHANSTRAVGNSFIRFRALGAVLAGQIHQIFLHRRPNESTSSQTVEPFFIVKAYTKLSLAHRRFDPYVAFVDLETSLCYNTFLPTIKILKLDDIICHFLSYVYTPPGIDEECIVVRSLDRVSFTLPLYYSSDNVASLRYQLDRLTLTI